MCVIHLYFWIYILFVCVTNIQAQSCGNLSVTPRIAFESEAVTFSYQLLANRSGTIRLFKGTNNGTIEVFPNHTHPDSRIEMKRNHPNISFILKDVKIQDAGEYISDCSKSFHPTSSVSLDVKAYPSLNLSFNEIRDMPEINCRNCLLGWEGRHTNVECILEGISYSDELDINLQFEKDGVRVDQSGITAISYGSSIQASFGLEPTINLDGRTVKCSMSSVRLSKEINTEATLRVLRTPSVPRANIKGIVKENERVLITCRSPEHVATPIPTIKYNNTEYIGNRTGSETSLSLRLSRYDNGRPLQCCLIYRTFEKDILNSTNTVCGPENYMDVRYQSYITISRMDHTNTIVAFDDETIDIECEVDANPVPTVQWFTYSSKLSDIIDQLYVYLKSVGRTWLPSEQFTALRNDFSVPYIMRTMNVAYGRWLKLNADRSMKPGRYNYTCSTSNGIGPRHVNKTVTLHVKAKQQIETTMLSSPSAIERQDTTLAPSSGSTTTHVAVAASCTSGVVLSLAIMVYCFKRRQLKKNIRRQSNPSGAPFEPALDITAIDTKDADFRTTKSNEQPRRQRLTDSEEEKQHAHYDLNPAAIHNQLYNRLDITANAPEYINLQLTPIDSNLAASASSRFKSADNTKVKVENHWQSAEPNAKETEMRAHKSNEELSRQRVTDSEEDIQNEYYGLNPATREKKLYSRLDHSPVSAEYYNISQTQNTNTNTVRGLASGAEYESTPYEDC